MKNAIIRYALIVGCAIVFYLVFWQEQTGLNLLLYSLAVSLAAGVIDKELWKRTVTRSLLIGWVLIAIANVIFDSQVARICYFIAVPLVAGSLAVPVLRNILYALPVTVVNSLFAPMRFLRGLFVITKSYVQVRRIYRWSLLLIIPLILAFVFTLIYSNANPVFGDVVNRITGHIFDWLSTIFTTDTLTKTGFFIIGLLLSTVLLVQSDVRKYYKYDEGSADDLYAPKKTELALRKSAFLSDNSEYRIALLSLFFCNILLLAVNVIDVVYVWLGFSYKPGMNLSKLVHQGTDLLILSIVLSMAVLLYFFRGQLNFHRHNVRVKALAYAWIAQNAFMACSVIVQNSYYIGYDGLTYKRIGVLIYVVLTIAGLITMWVKIKRHKTIYYLFRINGWIAFMVMIVMSFFNWDGWIATYNIRHKDSIAFDSDYIYGLSDDVLPDMYQNYNLFNKYEGKIKDTDSRRADFITAYDQSSRLSFNIQRQRVYYELKKIKK